MSCTSCGSNNIEYDGASGSSYCNVCGLVLEESAIVSELTFGESSSGAAILQGSYVSADKGRISLHGPYKRGGMESREQTIENGRRRIQQMATALRLPERYQESAQRYYNLAVTNNFVKGRRTQNVVAVCLYVVCRMEKSSHMLIDFSDLLQINVFTLGSTFLKFIRILHLTVPLIDPSLYISRFAAMMDLGDHTQRVAQDAVRLVQRMDCDWMHIGRRPSGICGACLLIAARVNGFRRTQREIVTIIKVAEVTLRKRLDEFKLTPSSNLSVRDFRSVWLEEEWDPPAFTIARKKQRLLADRAAASSAAGSSRKRKKSVRFNKGDEEEEEEEEEEEGEEAEENEGDEAGENQDRAEDMFRIDRVEVEGVMAAVVAADAGPSAAAVEEDVALEAEVDEVLRDERVSKIAVDIEERRKEEEREKRQEGEREKRKEEPGSLSDVDDDEIESVILNEEEIVLKTRVWYEFNKEYLEEQAVKRRKEEEEKRNGVHKNKGKRKPKRPSGPSGPAATPAEAARQMLQARRPSRKIDYSKLEALFETPDGVLELKSANPSRHTTPRSPSVAAAATPLPHPPTALQTLIRTGVRFPFLQGLVEEGSGGAGGTYETDDGYEVVDETGVEVGVRVKRPRVPILPAKPKEPAAGTGAGTGTEAEDEEEETVGEEERLMLEARRALGYEVEEEGDYWDEYNEDD